MTLSPPIRFLLVLVPLTGAVLLLPLVANRGLVFLAGVVAINVVLGLSFNLLFSTAGLLSFGQATFSAAGAYAVALLLLRVPELPFVVALAVAAAVGATIATLIGLVALRRTEGVYFAVLTLAFAELVHVVIAKTSFFGRNDGLAGIPRPRLGPIDLAQGHAYYVFVVLVTALLIACLWWVTHSRLGRSFRAVRLDPMRAAFLGIDVRRRRLEAFAISGACAATAGGLMGPLTSIVSPDLAHWAESTKPILFTLLGGAGHFWGPLVGAIVFSGVEYGTRSLAGASDLITGGLLLAVVLAIPGGLLGLAALVVGRLRRKGPPEKSAVQPVAEGGRP
ncbi:branched-chain amino acid ABC transporter permease [Phreatobacter sp. AB_2022a]|uniref:branched-chain amino acid ABC transporter permease n=1 Tax=Phreatobacter sp. AB_2022a TaxID=3003134 RepID=UPI002286F159|nr:branched-chain amino acid ABC transporter permease [Phreatobacter sp. AB_2022a]MCZ0736189.1 branched-chain amino acid ABC transporter permease [Phreatobacter sp. AB_2022a]